MPNHFHLVLETPEPNLVTGMKWFLGAYTQKYSRRHGLRGHVFQGRYKALMVEAGQGEYLATVSTYVHLNPARAGLLAAENPRLTTYEWSSYPAYVGKKARPDWLVPVRVLGNLGLKDDRVGRESYEEYLQERIRELRTKAGRKRYRVTWDAIRYGWCLGGGEFEDGLVNRLKGVVSGRRRESYSGPEMMRHEDGEAQRLVKAGLRLLKLDESRLDELKKGALEKRLLAWLVWDRTGVGQRWICERLKMGAAGNVGRYIQEVRQSRDVAVAGLRKKLSAC
jgi:hypothetical protein